MTNEAMNQTETVELVGEILLVAHRRAKAQGLSVAEYVQSLIVKDKQAGEEDPWDEPVPAHVSQQWEREIAEFDAQDEISPRPGAKTVAEFMKLLEREAAQLPDDEEH